MNLVRLKNIRNGICLVTVYKYVYCSSFLQMRHHFQIVLVTVIVVYGNTKADNDLSPEERWPNKGNNNLVQYLVGGRLANPAGRYQLQQSFGKRESPEQDGGMTLPQDNESKRERGHLIQYLVGGRMANPANRYRLQYQESSGKRSALISGRYYYPIYWQARDTMKRARVRNLVQYLVGGRLANPNNRLLQSYDHNIGKRRGNGNLVQYLVGGRLANPANHYKARLGKRPNDETTIIGDATKKTGKTLIQYLVGGRLANPTNRFRVQRNSVPSIKRSQGENQERKRMFRVPMLHFLYGGRPYGQHMRPGYNTLASRLTRPSHKRTHGSLLHYLYGEDDVSDTQNNNYFRTSVGYRGVPGKRDVNAVLTTDDIIGSESLLLKRRRTCPFLNRVGFPIGACFKSRSAMSNFSIHRRPISRPLRSNGPLEVNWPLLHTYILGGPYGKRDNLISGQAESKEQEDIKDGVTDNVEVLKQLESQSKILSMD